MAFQHGSGAYFSIDNSGGTPTDLSAYVNDVQWNRPIASHDTTNFGSSGNTEKTAGLKDATFTVTGIWDPTCDATIAGIEGLTGSFVVGPEGNVSGDVQYSGEALCVGYNISTPVGDMVTWNASFEVTGAVTRATV